MAETSEQPKRHQYQGDLRDTALPEMLYTIYQHRVPGVIEAIDGTASKKIFVRDGAVIHTTSTDGEDSLGAWLLRAGRITDQQLAHSEERRLATGRRHGEVLIDEDVLSPAQLYEAVQEQMRAVVWSLFAWQQGQVSFSIGDFEEPDMIRIHLPLRQVIVEGVKRAPDAKALVARLGRKDSIFEPTWRTEDLIEIAVSTEDLSLLRLIDGRRSLYELCTTGPYPPAENARLLYAFRVLRLIRRQPDPPSGVVRIKFR
jgi:two-component system, OmpR family, response regulator